MRLATPLLSAGLTALSTISEFAQNDRLQFRRVGGQRYFDAAWPASRGAR